MHCIRNRWGFGFYVLRLYTLSVETFIWSPDMQSGRLISYSWPDSIYEDPGSQLAVKLSWGTFLETTVLFCCVLHRSLEAGLSSTSTLQIPSEQGSLLRSVCVESLWDSSGINKLLKAACYDVVFFFFPRNWYRFFAGCCSVINILRLILRVVLISARLAEFAMFH